MLQGRFGDTSGRPYPEGRLILPRLGIHGNISFIVDAGADSTVLMPLDALRMGLDYSKLSGDISTTGIGGNVQMFPEQATVVFLEGSATLHTYLITINIPSYTPDIGNIPSLLGRDILDHWRMYYNPTKGTLTFKVHSADHTIHV